MIFVEFPIPWNDEDWTNPSFLQHLGFQKRHSQLFFSEVNVFYSSQH